MMEKMKNDILLEKFVKDKQDSKIEYLVYNRLPIIIRDQLTNNIDLDHLVTILEDILPREFTNDLDSIIILDSKIFDQREVNAFYHDRKLYVSNKQDNLDDLLDDILHEYAHALEAKYSDLLYSDQQIKDEFMLKRSRLSRAIGYQGFDINAYDFNNIEYNKEFDNFLYKDVSYELIDNLTNHGLFISPYAATSLREYFAVGVEEYLLGNKEELKAISPALFFKIEEFFGTR